MKTTKPESQQAGEPESQPSENPVGPPARRLTGLLALRPAGLLLLATVGVFALVVLKPGRHTPPAPAAPSSAEVPRAQLELRSNRLHQRGVTILLSANRDGTSSGNGSSTVPVLSADGRTVLFQSFADDLAPGDYNFSRDIFIAQIGGPDSDGDGMDDDWEMAYFSTLSRDGVGDFDGDGASDLAEFKAGTDPTNLGSILRVITITSLGGGRTRLVWSSSPGRTYRVQFKGNFEGATWSELPGAVTAVGTTASVTDESADAAPHRFYRVILTE
jgi:hypothetical protein